MKCDDNCIGCINFRVYTIENDDGTDEIVKNCASDSGCYYFLPNRKEDVL